MTRHNCLIGAGSRAEAASNKAWTNRDARTTRTGVRCRALESEAAKHRTGEHMSDSSIVIRGAREHNLKNVDVEIPRDKLVVITGLSGSGKSSLAFDTIYAEGQRRYVESLSSYARQFLGQMDKPDLDSIDGLSPAVSIDQKTTSQSALDGGYSHGDLRLSAPALRTHRHAALPRMRSRYRAPDHRPGSGQVPGTGHGAARLHARARGDRPQGRVRQSPRRPARRRFSRVRIDGEVRLASTTPSNSIRRGTPSRSWSTVS